MREIKEVEDLMGKPFTLPPGQFKPKQSLGQNFLSDQNYVRKIVNTMSDKSDKGSLVIEIGPGLGALTRLLYPKYPNMRCIEIDDRAVDFLREKMPDLRVIHLNALDADWAQLAADRSGKLNIIGNLPYYVVSQILFSLVDHYKAIATGVFTMQLEVAERLIAKPKTKQYGIPSIVFQLYCTPTMNFKIPPTVFYPVPKVDSALVTLDFSTRNPALDRVQPRQFRRYAVSVSRYISYLDDELVLSIGW
jgi:16S rRNA (adenine1518-N6/adenine1519-N6)-dimethyltransferase